MGSISSPVDSADAYSVDGHHRRNLTAIELSSCHKANENIDTFFKFFFVVSVVITFALSFVVRRKNRLHNCCWARPGILQPVNFVDEIGRRWAYAACFVILTYNVMMLFDGDSYWNLMPKKTDKEWMKKYGWVKVLNKLWEVLSVCLVYYPLLACVNHRRSIAANVIGFLYLIPWIMVYTEFFISCPARFQTGIFGVVFHLFRAPIYIALYVVGVSYVLDFVRNMTCIIGRCRQKANASKSAEHQFEYERVYKISHHMEYVKNLLRQRRIVEDNKSMNIIKLKSRMLAKKVKYEKVFGFRYSTRLICCLTVAVTILFWVMVQMGVFIESVLIWLRALCSSSNRVIYAVNPVFKTFSGSICEVMIAIKVLSHIANALSGIVVIIFLVNTLITYKRCWHRLLRGDHSWHVFGSRICTPHSTLLKGLKFGGYQVAYAIWGWAVLFMLLWVIFMLLTFGLVLPLTKGETGWIVDFFIDHGATLMLGIFVIPFIQRLVCQFVFLQGKGSVLALDNRRIYNATSYYFLVLNIIVGFFSCLKRILYPLVLGITYLSRLDQPLIMKGYEKTDPGYASFVSMLLVDLHHNHPVVKTFVEILLQAKERQKNASDEIGSYWEKDNEKLRRSRRLRNRWMKTVTLINNPSLALKLLERRLIEEFQVKTGKDFAQVSSSSAGHMV